MTIYQAFARHLHAFLRRRCEPLLNANQQPHWARQLNLIKVLMVTLCLFIKCWQSMRMQKLTNYCQSLTKQAWVGRSCKQMLFILYTELAFYLHFQTTHIRSTLGSFWIMQPISDFKIWPVPHMAILLAIIPLSHPVKNLQNGWRDLNNPATVLS